MSIKFVINVDHMKEIVRLMFAIQVNLSHDDC